MCGPSEDRVRSDRETVDRRRAEVQAVEAELEKAEVVSPIDGRIVEAKASPGLRVEAVKGPALFVIAPNSGTARVKVEANTQDAATLAPNEEIAMRFRELGAEQFYGVVRSTSAGPKARTAPNSSLT